MSVAVGGRALVLDKGTQEEAVEAFRRELKKRGRLVACLEFAAKLNRELPPPPQAQSLIDHW